MDFSWHGNALLVRGKRRIGTRLAILALAVVMLPACDPLVEDGFHGDALFSIEGRIVDFSFGTEELNQPLASLMWSSSGDTTTDPALLQARSEVSVQVSFPSTFRINVFDAPELARSGNRPYAIGELVVWQDENEDGKYSIGEYRGAAFDRVILFADNELSALESPTGRVLPRGFSLASLPLPCYPVEPLPQANDCGVPLGAACTVEGRECGIAGTCLLDDGYTTYPGGYCVLQDNSECTPEGGVPWGGDEFGGFVWMKACVSHEDCRAAYSCEYWLGACLPKLPLAIIIDAEYQFEPLCQDPL